jgi:hypothetical protein
MEVEESTLEERQQLQERVTIHEPAEGWSRESYDQALDDYVVSHGRAPQTVTMHPDTMETLGLSPELEDYTPNGDTPLLVPSRDYDRESITFYY